MSMIQVEHLTFSYDGSYDTIFEDVSFQIDTDWKLGFIGRNGRGKTTFLNLLLGRYEYQGKIHSPVQFDYFPFAVPDLTESALEITQTVCPELELWELCRELSLLEVDEEVLYRPFQTLSHGERTKVLLAALFLKQGHFLLIDEPTNHLDRHAREVVSTYLKRKKGFILVSHDREFLDGCIDHVLSINKTNIEVQKGNFASWQQNKDWQDQYELAENNKLKREIHRLDQAAKKARDWSDKTEKEKFGEGAVDRGYLGHKAAKMMKRSKTAQRRRIAAVEEKSQLLKNIDKADALFLKPEKHYSDILVQAKDLSLFYGGKEVCSNIDFVLRQGARIAVVGKNGSGKSTLLKLLAGEQIKYQGMLQTASGISISYVPQDTSFLKGTLKDFAQESKIEESRFKTILRKFDFSRLQFEKDMEEFSEGQKKKVVIARSLCQSAHLYLWDEPLNFIDVLSRIQIQELIVHCRPTMMFVEHDGAFVDQVATETLQL